MGADIQTFGGGVGQVAASQGNVEAAQLLLLGADVNSPAVNRPANNSTLCSAIQYAAGRNDIEFVKILLDKGAGVNAPSLHNSLGTGTQLVARDGGIKVVEKILDAGAVVDAFTFEEGIQTALQRAVQRVDSQGRGVIQILSAEEADVNAPKENQTGRSILGSATCTGNEELVQILLDKGADVNSPPIGEEGRSPIQEAVGRGSIPLVELLLKSGANVNASAGNLWGRTANPGSIICRVYNNGAYRPSIRCRHRHQRSGWIRVRSDCPSRICYLWPYENCAEVSRSWSGR